MEFGRLEKLAGVDFVLPADPLANQAALARWAQVRTEAGVALLGLSGWSEKEYVGSLYPQRTLARDFLSHYGRIFASNELNSTYYGIARERTERWAAAVPDSFRFCPKLSREITHDCGLRHVDEWMERFVEAAAGFGLKSGRVWGLMPESFGPDQGRVLEEFVLRWADQLPLAIELRHPAWFADERARERALACFEEHDVAAILTDVAGRRDVLHMRLTSQDMMLRFVGNSLHPTDLTRLDAWVERIVSWLDAGLRTAYVFFHQKQGPQAVELARHFAMQFEKRTGIELLPELAGGASPGASANQLELFPG
ncbi:MAG: hypothetical protein ACI841_000036 [Planctomycetota bacterium]|jgi:uncharacterized protein YecE (DUF72 family)